MSQAVYCRMDVVSVAEGRIFWIYFNYHIVTSKYNITITINYHAGKCEYDLQCLPAFY